MFNLLIKSWRTRVFDTVSYCHESRILHTKSVGIDATKRANNPETPAAHVFNDVDLGMLDEPEAESNQDTNKRPLTEVDMDIDQESVPKRRRWIM